MNRLDTQAIPLWLILGALLACGGAAPEAKLADGAEGVKLGKADAPPGAIEIGPVEATHGHGCGMYGEEGNFEGAYALLRNEGARVDADYVQIMTATEPYSDGKCGHNEYKLTGVAYKVPTAIEPTQPSGAANRDQRSCVPGSTQACLGPGACKGAQACRDDGLSFEKCDCGGASTSGSGASSQ